MATWAWSDASDLFDFMAKAVEYAEMMDMTFAEAYAFLVQNKNDYFKTINPGHSCKYMDIYDISSYSINAGQHYYPKDIGILFIIIYYDPDWPNRTFTIRAAFPKEKREEMN